MVGQRLIPAASHKHDQRWIADQLQRLPRRFRGPVAARYAKTFKGHSRYGRRNANTQLRRLVESLPGTAYGLASNDDALRAFAETRARQAGRMWLRDKAGRAYEIDERCALLSAGVRAFDLLPPEPDGERVTVSGAVARMQCPLWWRRAIRTDHGRNVEGTARTLGLVSKSAGIYSSDETVYRRRGQKTRNRRMLEEVKAVNELGESFTLAELADVSVSNPVIRRGELMTRIAGFEAIARDLGHVGEFITLTCPGHMHSAILAGGRGHAIDNPRYDGTNPREAQAHLRKVWGRIRSKLARHGIKLYGFRVAEPNHDGTPHWHLLVFLPPWARRRVRRTFHHYGLQLSPNEPGAQRHRVTYVRIDPERGTAAGYIAKYIAKNIDGAGLDCDLYGNDPIEAAERVDAWASCWGIRQFQQVGGPPVTVWRELRRLDCEESGTLEAARDAADRGDWAAFVRAMGGPLVPRDQTPVRPAYWQEIDTATGELPLNRYGEVAAGQVFGVRVGDVFHVTRMHRWTFERTPAEPDKERWSLRAVGEAFTWDRAPLVRGAAARPWSPVNNCTRDVPGQPPPQHSDPPDKGQPRREFAAGHQPKR